MNKILIPTDFSDAARNAFKYAISLYGENVHYVLLNSYEEPSTSTSSMISLKDILHESSVDSLKDELEYVKTELNYPNLKISTRSVYGDTVSAIEFYMRENDVDLIIMGTTGASGLKEVLIGSVASSVIQKVNCPVFAIPANYKFSGLNKILFASDLRKLKKGELPAFFVDLVQKQKSEVTILTVTDDKPVSEDQAESGYDLHLQLKGISHRFETIEDDDIDEGIDEYAHAEGMDLVVTVPRKGSWFSRLLKPSISKRLAHHLDIPMLALSQK